VARSAVLFSEEDLTRFLQVMLRTYDELNYRQEQRFHLELGLVKLVHLQRLLPVEELLSQLPSSGKSGLGGGTLPKVAASAPKASVSASPAKPAAVTPAAVTPPPARAVEPARAPDPPKPAFSPFEADRNRKITGEASPETPVSKITEITAITEIATIPEITAEPVPTPRALTPLEATARAIETAPIKAPSMGVVETVTETTNGALALATEPLAPPATADVADLDRIREAVCIALNDQGHNTASALLDAGKWTTEGDTIKVEVGIKKTMLGLTMNIEAEKIAKNAMRSVGASQKLVVVPGEGMAMNTAAKPRVAASGSVQAAALENPLVKQAMELFRAEVRTVLDLRDK
jgi:DNA polymerase-3 subunit gamma/tau